MNEKIKSEMETLFEISVYFVNIKEKFL